MHERAIRHELSILREHVGHYAMVFYGVPVDAMSRDELTALISLLFHRLSKSDPVFAGVRCRRDDECSLFSGGKHQFKNGICACGFPA